MYQSDLTERLLRVNHLIHELTPDIEHRGIRGGDVGVLIERRDRLITEQLTICDGLFGPGVVRYNTLHRTTFPTEWRTT